MDDVIRAEVGKALTDYYQISVNPHAGVTTR
jgi:hypothetical protein